MKVIRTQWPVGQGCFATGVIDADGPFPIHYVYDCGARNTTNLKPIVSRYANSVGHLDAVFISHLDGDHVDGLDTLLEPLKTKAVYLPYLTPAQRIAVIMEAEETGRLTASLVQAQLDPGAWFGSRGVDEVVFVRGDTQPPEDGFVPGPDPRHGPEPVSRAEKDRVVLKRTTAIPFRKQSGALNAARLMSMHLGGHAEAVQAGSPRWLLVPHVPKVDPKRIRAFHKAVVDALELNPGELTYTRLADELKTAEGRSRLRGCYEEILNEGAGRNHNKVSMSLYSGPANPSGWKASTSRSAQSWWDWKIGDHLPGWLGTGDAKLKSKQRRQEWQAFYKKLLGDTGTMLLPHHGSAHNWHRDLLQGNDIQYLIAAADEPTEGYKHPSGSVVLDIQDMGRSLIHVSKQTNSRLIEQIEG